MFGDPKQMAQLLKQLFTEKIDKIHPQISDDHLVNDDRELV